MKNKLNFLILFLVLTICLFPVKSVFAGSGLGGNAVIAFSDTDANIGNTLFYFFDLRDRETFIQLTVQDSLGLLPPSFNNFTAHVQIFDVSNNCNENDFFDDYTNADTHVYNMRDIQANDGNPSGVVLPGSAYGIVAITTLAVLSGGFLPATIFGNLRIIDNNGYEYRTNAQVSFPQFLGDDDNDSVFYSFNFNDQSDINLSDVVGITLFNVDDPTFFTEWIAEPVQAIFSPFDIDIVDNNETIFSCRDNIYSCVDKDNPLLEELLSIAGTANVASFEYGINNAIPHSKGGELLCPGNTISEGTVILRPEIYPDTDEFNQLVDQTGANFIVFVGYVGLNNGNGRGTMDSFWTPNFCMDPFSGLCPFPPIIGVEG